MNKDVTVDGIDEEHHAVDSIDEGESLAIPDEPPPDESTEAWSKAADPVSANHEELQVK